MQLRDYQQRAIAELREYVRQGGRRGVIAAPTGAGKTAISGEIFRLAREKGRRVCFTVPSLSLIDQTVRAFHEHGIDDVGVIQADHPMTDLSKPVQIASVQSLMRRDMLPFDLVVVDEVHKLFEFYGDWMAKPEFAKVPFVGLSATPWTKGLGKLFDHLIIAETTAGLIKQGYLCPFRVFAPGHPDLTGVGDVAGDYNQGQLSHAMQQGSLIADVVDTWRELGEDRPTVVFAVDRAHAQLLQKQFEECGIPTGYCDYKTTRENRDTLREKFESGDIRVAVNVQTLTTGLDWPTIACVVLARPTRSEMLYVQMIGRGLRLHPSKSDLLILDHSDTTERLGFVDSIMYSELNDGSPREKAEKPPEALPKMCPVCTYLKPPRTPVCPNCGHVAKVVSTIRTEAGELREVKPGDLISSSKDKVADRLARLAPNGLLQGMLQTVADERGYQPGWVSHKYKTLTGRWPKYKHVTPRTPSSDLRNWLRSQDIRYAKRREREDAGRKST